MATCSGSRPARALTSKVSGKSKLGVNTCPLLSHHLLTALFWGPLVRVCLLGKHATKVSTGLQERESKK